MKLITTDKSPGATKPSPVLTFEETALAWDDKNIIILRSPYLEESRFLAPARIYNKIWTVVFTPRNDEIRIIPARRARNEEAAYYEKHETS
jgi:uncharacterized DUF497 family protein